MSLFQSASSPVNASSQAQIVLVNVPCDPSVVVTNVVRMSAGVAVKAAADNLVNSNLIGVVEKKNSSTTCNVRVSGVTPDIFAGLDETKEYYLSVTPGGISTSPPTASGEVIVKVGQPFSATKLLVNKGQRTVRA